MKVVVDTNVFISGIFWEGNYCSKIIEAWRSKRIFLVTSSEIVQELVEVLSNFKIKMSEDMIDEWRTMILENSVIVRPLDRIDVVKEDKSDNKFFEAALAGNARFIVSQDKNVLKIKEYKGIVVIHPNDFIKLISA